MGYVGYEKIMLSLTRNDYEPDLCCFNKTTAQTFHPEQMRFPAPDFVVEILSKSAAATDRGIKFEDYAAHSISEYWIIDPEAQVIEQYILQDSSYYLKQKSDSGVITGDDVNGFEIPVQAVFDQLENMKALQIIFCDSAIQRFCDSIAPNRRIAESQNRPFAYEQTTPVR